MSIVNYQLKNKVFSYLCPEMTKIKIIAPSRLNGEITLPMSKSIANRVLIIRKLISLFTSQSGASSCPTPTLLKEFENECEDIRILAKALDKIDTNTCPQPTTLDIGNSGTAMRFLTALSGLMQGTFILTGSERMKERPIAPLVDAMRQLGTETDYLGQFSFPPLIIKGSILDTYNNQLDINASISSQFISALLLIAPLLKNGLTLHLQGDIVSKPYIDLTIEIMRRFGAIVCWTDEKTISVTPSRYKDCHFEIEGDWTAASYWFEIMMFQPDCNIKIKNLCHDSIQGDSIISKLMKSLQTHCSHPTNQPFTYDFRNNPDLVQTIAATCFGLGIPYHFTGTDTLRIKETDRIQALENELNKLRQGNYCISTYNDHRMAMAFAPLALKLPYIIIENPEVVNKSYPTYWAALESVGFKCQRYD